MWWFADGCLCVLGPWRIMCCSGDSGVWVVLCLLVDVFVGVLFIIMVVFHVASGLGLCLFCGGCLVIALYVVFEGWCRMQVRGAQCYEFWAFNERHLRVHSSTATLLIQIRESGVVIL